MSPQTLPELLLSLLSEPAQLQGQLLTLLKQYLLVHILLSQNIFWVCLFVQIGALVVQAVGAF